MGFDIYGRKPKITTEEPAAIDYKTASDDEKSQYRSDISKWQHENPGIYIRYNIGGWPPILFLCETASKMNNLKLKLNDWGYNDGNGLKTQKQCTKLADGLNDLLKYIEGSTIKFEKNNEVIAQNDEDEDEDENEDDIFLYLGSWERVDELAITDIEIELLNERFPYGAITGSVIGINGVQYAANFSTSMKCVNNFIDFLRQCGGFEIW